MAEPTATGVATRAMFSRILRSLLLMLGVVAAISLIAGYALRGSRGLAGAALALGLAALFVLTTVVVMRATANRPIYVASAAAVGSWLVKVTLVFVVLLLVKGKDFYDPVVFIATLFVLVIASSAIEIRGAAAARIPHVEPNAGPGA